MLIQYQLIPERAAKRLWDGMRKGESANGCWLWVKSVDSGGYGHTTYRLNGKTYSVRTHKLAYVLSNGVFDDSKLCVLHTCDNRRCINPKHLWLGTRADNNADKIAKGRAIYPPSGSRHWSSKLNEETVKEIKIKIRDGHSNPQLAEEYGVSKQTISHIRCGYTWHNV